MFFQENEKRNSTIKVVIQKMLLAKIENNKENMTPQNLETQKSKIQNRITNQNLRKD